MSNQLNDSQVTVVSDPFRYLQEATRIHRREHGCGAYTFEDGVGLINLAAKFKPKRVLELGTALGYSSCCLSFGSPNATVDTIERDPEHVELARRNIAAGRLSDRIAVHEGDFADVLQQLSTGYNFIFFDGFAPEVSVMKLLANLLDRNGVLVCANLNLVPMREARRIRSILGESTEWRSLPEIEACETAVWQKI